MTAIAETLERSRRAPPPLWIVLGLQFALYTALAAILGTWHDEEYTLATTAHGVAYAVHRAIAFELQAPLYFALLALVREADPSPLVARMVSVACALGVTSAFAGISRRLWPALPAWRLAALAAFNPFIAFAALEIRLYALATLVSALLWLAFYDGFFAGTARRAQIAFVLLAIAALYLQYFLAFELVGFGVALVVAARWRALGMLLIAGALTLVAFVPMLVVLHGQVGAAFSVTDSKPAAFYSVFLHPVVDFVVPFGYGELIVGSAGHLLNAGLVLGVVAAVVLARPHLDRTLVALVAIPATIEAFYIVLADVLHYELIIPRHFVALFVPDLAAAFALLQRMHGARVLPARRLAVGVVALATLLSLFATYRPLAKHGDWIHVGGWLTAHAQPGDTIAISVADAVPAFERYYRGRARVVPYPRRLDPDKYDVNALTVHSDEEAQRSLAALPANGRLWFVLYGTCDHFDWLGCLETERVLARDYDVLERQQFYDALVVRLQLRAAHSSRVPARPQARRRSASR